MNEQIFTATNGVQVKYKHKPNKYDFKHLIIVFSGFNSPVPSKYDFIRALDNCPCDVIWISDDFEGMHSYYLCINMDFKIEEAVTEFISFQTNKKGLSFKSVTVTGFSKGGSAALYYGLKLNINNIVISVPQIYIGDYLVSEWEQASEHMMGIAYSKLKVQYLNNILPRMLKEDSNLKKNIYLLTSESDVQYDVHLKPNLHWFLRYNNFNLLKTYSLLVRQHKDITRHHVSLLLSIYYALASEAIPRFENGEVNFFGSQPISVSKPTLEPYVDLHGISLIEKRLFINGVALLRGIDVEEYSDINYQLIFKGENNYTKELAKSNKPDLTKDYFQNEIVVYDKCWFTTHKNKGIDISDINEGTYVLFIQISSKGHEAICQIVSENTIVYSRKTLSFNSDDVGNEFIIEK